MILYPEQNSPARAGERASAVAVFGPRNRYALYAIHTRFEAVCWVIADAELPDAVTECPGVVWQMMED